MSVAIAVCAAHVHSFRSLAARRKSSRGVAWNMHRFSPLIIIQPDNARPDPRGISISLALKKQNKRTSHTVSSVVSRSFGILHISRIYFFALHARLRLTIGLIRFRFVYCNRGWSGYCYTLILSRLSTYLLKLLSRHRVSVKADCYSRFFSSFSLFSLCHRLFSSFFFLTCRFFSITFLVRTRAPRFSSTNSFLFPPLAATLATTLACTLSPLSALLQILFFLPPLFF